MTEEKRPIRLIALDLDGTLLNTDKQLTERNRDALYAAAEKGIFIVPSTGRFYKGMPDAIRALPFVRYVITINGAQVIDLQSDEPVYSADIPTDEALALYHFLDTVPVIYDCYTGGWGYMTARMQEMAAEYVGEVHALEMVRRLRSPVPELKKYLAENGLRPQKIQLFTKNDVPYREKLMGILKEKYPQFAISSSLYNNVEINSHDADKGLALRHLWEHLGLRRDEVMAFGDGLNDLAMLKTAGYSVAMGNAHPDVKAVSDVIAEDCDHDGVARVIETLLREDGSC